MKMKIGLVAAAVILCLIMICGCETQKSADPKELADAMPANATNVTDKGNGWTSFELDGNKYLYHRSCEPNLGYEAITVIPNE